MKPFISALLLVGTLGAHSGVHAQSSTLRIACKGKDVGAEVTIDGQFKGECPLEAQVRAGTVKLRLVKKVDSLRERVFEQEIRLGDDVVKQIDVALSAPRLIAGGQGRGNTSPAAESAESGSRAQTDTAAPQGLTPPRPPIPLGISEDIWKIIEASEAYRNLPQPRGIKVVFQGKQEREYTGSKSRSLPNPGAKTISTTRVITPVGEKCTMMLYDSVAEGTPNIASGTYYCGSIWLGSASGGKPGMIISSIDELKGSLFPMRVGARQTTRYQMAYLADRKYDSTRASDCAVVGRQAAQELDPRLKGTAWKVHCKSSYSSNNSNKETETDDYYLEDLAVMLSFIGAHDTSKKAHVLPSAGTQTVIESEGDYGSRNITSYASYNWETGGTYEVPVQVATIAASSNDGRLEAEKAAAAAADNAARAHQNIAAAARRPAQAEKPASGGSGFFGAVLGGLASGLLDRNAAMLNSAAASTGGAGGAVMGELANANTQLARETREKIAKDMGGNGGVEGVAGTAVGSALGSGSMAGAVSALSGATNNLAGAALSGSAGSGANAGSGAASGGCCSSASERIADNRARGAPDGFETNNERICRERGSRAYCEAGVTERRLNLGGLEKFTGGGGLGSTAASLAGASAVVGSCATPMSQNFDNRLQANFSKYKDDGQCGPIVQAAEALRIKAIANCKAGDAKSADLIYQGQYLKQMVGYVKTACP